MSDYSPQQYPSNPYSPQATLGQPNKPARGGGSGWKWLVIILGIGGFGMIACCGACAGLFYVGLNVIKQTPPYQMAMTKVRESADVNDKIGNPIEDSVDWTSEQQGKFDEDHLTVKIRIKGPKGEGTVAVKGVKEGETWTLEDCTVTFPDGTTKQLADAAHAAPDHTHTEDDEGSGKAPDEMKEEAAAPTAE